jgi:hypothetical protein
VFVNRTFRISGGVRDVIERRGNKAFLAEHLLGCIEQ